LHHKIQSSKLQDVAVMALVGLIVLPANLLPSLDDLVVVLNKLRAGRKRKRLSIPGWNKRFLCSAKCQDRLVAHPVLYSTRARASFLAFKAAGL
jgi:hypothetical protein